MTLRFAILGSGAWGTTVAMLLAQQPDHDVRLWSARADNAEQLQRQRENVDLLPGIRLAETILLTADIREAVEQVDLLVVAVPTVYLRTSLASVTSQLPRGIPIMSLVKGIERQTFLRPTQILEELTGTRPMAVLSGPSHAEEVSRGLPASVVLASQDKSLAEWIQPRLNTERFRVYTNADLVGVELAGALKNVIAIAAGISEGLELGDNAKAALITRGLVEMTRFGKAHGALRETFAGLAGMGDLITTCMSGHGRNRRVGLRLAQGDSLQEILESTKMVAEGVYTTQGVHGKAQQLKVPMPITQAVYQILYEDKPPRQAVDELMMRTLKSEL
ncbi:MAG: NAD(P)H-dependent glycerol-3-phosphate dehydrogenase [Gemmataceae bacterium]